MSEQDIRTTQTIVENGHYMQLVPEYEMGGGVEGVTLYCWTCNPNGSKAIKTCNYWNYPDEETYTHREANLTLRKLAWRHAHPERQNKSKP